MILPKIKAILRKKDFDLFTRPFELNIVGIRSKSIRPNQFDDEIHVFFKVNALKWQYHIFKATTDPGTFWLNNPMQEQGTAILAEGQYKDTYQLGMHRKQYLALVQRKPLTIIRDYNRDAVLDFNNGRTTKGLYGINIHRANREGKTKTVGKNSAGCQVFENAEDFKLFLSLCQKHKSLYGNAFTYTLLDFRAVRRQSLRYLAYGIGTLSLLGLILVSIVYRNKLGSLVHSFWQKVIGKKEVPAV
jgi:hypothetical protein